MKALRVLSIPMFLVALALSSPLSSVRAEICNRIVAIVNNDVITLYELNAKIKELTGFEPSALKIEDDKGYIETRHKVLDLLIDEKISREKVQELGIKMTSEDVDGAIEKIKRDNYLTQEDLIAGLEKRGVSYDSYRDSIKNELERMELINLEVKSKIIISDEEIKRYYSVHRNEFSSEEKVRLASILLKLEDPSDQDEALSMRQKAQEIVVGLKNGEDFSELARKFSQGPGAADGGNLGFFKTSQLDPELIKVVKSLSMGEVSGPIARPSGIQFIKVMEKKEGRVKPLEEVRNTIYDTLYRKEIDKRYSSWIKGLREKAYTKVIF